MINLPMHSYCYCVHFLSHEGKGEEDKNHSTDESLTLRPDGERLDTVDFDCNELRNFAAAQNQFPNGASDSLYLVWQVQFEHFTAFDGFI